MNGPLRRRHVLLSIGLLGALAVLAYGPWMSSLGFYRDDWYVLWAGRAFGPAGIVETFAIDRPLVGWLFSLAYSVLGEGALGWQVYALVLRWLGAVLALMTFASLWPERPRETTVMAAIFLLYPGFLQQPNAMTFTNQLTTYLLAILSIALTTLALRTERPRRFVTLTVAALLTAALYQLLYEYMIGLEITRLALLVLAAGRRQATSLRARLRAVVAWGLPYSGVALVNVLWRGLVFESVRQATDLPGLLQGYAASPLRAVGLRMVELAKDFAEALIAGWVIPTGRFADSQTGWTLFGAIGIGLVAAAVFYGLMRWIPDPNRRGDDGNRAPAKEMVLVGIVSLLGGLLPVVFAFRDIHWDSGFDRYTLHVTLGIALVTVGGLQGWTYPRVRLPAALALIAVATFTQFLNGAFWSDFWQAQRQLWWQVSWRVPQFQPGTVLLVELPTGGYYEGYEVWAPANLIYDPSGQLRVVSDVFSEETAEKVRLATKEPGTIRRVQDFNRDFGRSLLVVRPTVASCYHVLDGKRPEYPVGADGLVRSLTRYSDISRIEVSGPPPSVPALFSPEPPHDWCYAYQQASLARQRQAWGEAAELGRRAFDQGWKPSDRSEWLPFLEAFVFVGDTESADRVADLIRDRESIRHDLCDQIRAGPAPGFSQETYRGVTDRICEFP